MDSLSTGILKGLPVLLPPIAEQRQLLHATRGSPDGIGRAVMDAKRESDLLREYRTRLIADVATGTVSQDAEA
jgi:type I restriction enzyme S subunit